MGILASLGRAANPWGAAAGASPRPHAAAWEAHRGTEAGQTGARRPERVVTSGDGGTQTDWRPLRVVMAGCLVEGPKAR